MLIWVTDAKYAGGYKIALVFNDGVEKTVDLSKNLWGEVFEPLQEMDNFKNFHLSDWTIEWYNGADIAPETLYAL